MTTESVKATAKPVAGCRHFKKAIMRRSGGWALASATLLGLLTFPSHAQTFTVLHNFKGGSDGANPEAGLVMDAKGNLYGTTYAGGAAGCQFGEVTCGTVFKLAGKKETVVHRFKGSPDGANPSGGLILDAEGNLYGVTSGGGADGCGTLFKVAPSGTETVLYSFCSDGGTGFEPSGNLVMDAAGNLYGTTLVGGSGNSGTVFKVDPSGTDTVLYNFCTKGGSRCTDGEEPRGGLVMDAAGNLYGTTLIDLGPKGTGGGAVFKVTQTGKETVLHLFSSAKDYAGGASPNGGLILDAAGNLYGTTFSGGTGSCCGTVFKVDASGKETVLYNFCSASGCTDGAYPPAGLFMDAKGNLYGTTLSGGTGTCTGEFSPGCGTVFELAASGKETVLHSFTGVAPDGAFPYSTLIMDANGNLYGTASAGGKFGNGIVFEITP
jgi:uncharacterized repeat protein (TIGR03803 family)